MTRYYNTAEGGSNSTAVSTGNSGGTSGTAFSSVSAGAGGSIVFSNSGPIGDTLSYLSTPASGVANYRVWTLPTTATGQFAFRIRWTIGGAPSSESVWMELGHATTGSATKINLSTGRILKVQTGAANTYRGNLSAAVPTGTVVRLEVAGTLGTGTSGSVTYNLYNDGTGSLIATYSISSIDLNTQINRVIWGKFTATGTMAAYSDDDWAFDDSSNTEIGPASTAYAGTPSDNVGVTDSATAQQDNVRSAADPVGVTDSAGATQTNIRTAADSVGLTDSVTAVITAVRSIADSVGITDAPGPQAMDISDTIDDPLGVTDSVAQLVTAVRTLADSVGLTDSVSAVLTATSSAADNVGLTDSVADVLDAIRGAADPAGITDTVSLLVNLVRQADDPVGITDSVSAVLTNAGTANVNDPEGITDAIDSALSAVRSAADPVGATDSVTVTLSSTRNVDDVVGLLDSVTAVVASVRTIADGVGVTDTVTAVLTSGAGGPVKGARLVLTVETARMEIS